MFRKRFSVLTAGLAIAGMTFMAETPASGFLFFEDFSGYDLYDPAELGPSFTEQSDWSSISNKESGVHANPQPQGAIAGNVLGGRPGTAADQVHLTKGVDWGLAGDETLIVEFMKFTPWNVPFQVKLAWGGNFISVTGGGGDDADGAFWRLRTFPQLPDSAVQSESHRISTGEWVQARWVVDLAANDFVGAHSLYYRTDEAGLFDDSVEWIAADDLQNISLRVDEFLAEGNTAEDRQAFMASLNGMRLRTDAAQNIYLAELSVIPEPTSAGLVLLGGLAMMFRRRRA